MCISECVAINAYKFQRPFNLIEDAPKASRVAWARSRSCLSQRRSLSWRSSLWAGEAAHEPEKLLEPEELPRPEEVPELEELSVSWRGAACEPEELPEPEPEELPELEDMPELEVNLVCSQAWWKRQTQHHDYATPKQIATSTALWSRAMIAKHTKKFERDWNLCIYPTQLLFAYTMQVKPHMSPLEKLPTIIRSWCTRYVDSRHNACIKAHSSQYVTVSVGSTHQLRLIILHIEAQSNSLV